jgi:hypothetical protein
VTLLLSQAHTDPEIVSVCPNAAVPNMQAAMIVDMKIFAFMVVLNSRPVSNATFYFAAR